MSRFIDPADLAPFATIDPVKAEAMIADAEAMACLAAPCLLELAEIDPPTPESEAAMSTAKAVLRQAILRWNERGAGSVTQTTVGGVSQTFASSGSILWNRDLDSLRDICSHTGAAFAIDTVPAGSIHATICALNFGASFCSCGADIAGYPLYES